MSESVQPCGVCGQPRSDRALQGLCRHCLLRVSLGMGGAPDDGGGGGPMFPMEESTPGFFASTGTFADYELVGEIARGGMGVVYKAIQRGLNRTVAIKMIAAGALARPEDLTRFRNEAEAVARLNHANIIAIHEVGELDGQPWFSMQYVAGPSLGAVMRTAPLPPQRAATLLLRVCGAIQHAHERGILHRDIKPSNILLDEGDEPRVTDFGVAKFATRESDVTGTDRVIGSPGYMSPEQALGRSRDVDARSDVYSLGAVLYALLTGRPPFQADTPVQTLKLVVDTEPVPPRQLNPAIPVDLETICLKCLAKEPARRYTTAAGVAAELSAFLDHRPIQARPMSRQELLARWCRRNPGMAVALTSLFVVLVAGLAGTTWQWRRAEAGRLATLAKQYDLLVARAVAERRSGVVGQRFSTLEALHVAGQMKPGAPRLRDEAITTLALADFEQGRKLETGALEPQRLSPDFRFIARGYTNGGVGVFRVQDGELEAVLETPGVERVGSLGFSPDGNRIWVGHVGGAVGLWAWRQKQCLQVLPPGSLRAGFLPAFAHGGNQFLFAKESRQLKVLDLSDGGLRTIDMPFVPRLLSCSPQSGTPLVSAWDEPSAVCLLDMVTGAVLRRLQLPVGVSAREGGWSADEEWIAVSGLDQKLYLFRPGTSEKPVQVIGGHENAITSIAFDPAGSMVATSAWDGTVQFHGLADAQRLLLLHQDARDLRFSPDGSELAFRGPKGEIVIGGFADQQVCRTLGGGEVQAALEGLHSAEFSLDSRWLVSASAAGTRIFDVNQGNLRETVSREPSFGAWLFGGHVWMSDPAGRPAWRGWSEGDPSRSAPTAPDRPLPRWADQGIDFSANGECLVAFENYRVSVQYRGQAPAFIGRIDRDGDLMLSRDGHSLVLSSGSNHVVWDTVGVREVARVARPGNIGRACLDPSGSRLCIRGKREVTCCELPSGRVLWSIPGEEEGIAGTFTWSADGRWILHQTSLHQILLISAADGRVLAHIEHPEARMIRHMALSGDGRWLAVACAKSVIQLWDIRRLRSELQALGLDWKD